MHMSTHRMQWGLMDKKDQTKPAHKGATYKSSDSESICNDDKIHGRFYKVCLARRDVFGKRAGRGGVVHLLLLRAVAGA